MMRVRLVPSRHTAWLAVPVRRSFAVKALSWCSSPTDSREPPETTKKEATKDDFEPISSFGIVAAMSSNRVIGINGKLPWRLPNDRKTFKDLTRGTVLIIGRRTLEENSLRRHIDHAAATVVLSKTMDLVQDDDDDVKLRVARSFPEALHIARLLVDELRITAGDDTRIPCWVAGGERVYHEALLHSNATELRLTVVDSEIRVLPDQEFAQFPASYRWDNKYKRISKQQAVDGGLGMTQYVYKHMPGRR